MSAIRQIIVHAAAIVLQTAATNTDQFTINPDTRMFIDPEGRSVIFHG